MDRILDRVEEGRKKALDHIDNSSFTQSLSFHKRPPPATQGAADWSYSNRSSGSAPPPPPPIRSSSGPYSSPTGSAPPPPPSAPRPRVTESSAPSPSYSKSPSPSMTGLPSVFSNLPSSEKTAFFSLLDEYFASRPHLLQDKSAAENTTKSSAPEPAPTTARALYAFEKQSADDLALSEGDVVTITEDVDASWYRGTLNGRTGIFPKTFVEVLQ